VAAYVLIAATTSATGLLESLLDIILFLPARGTVIPLSGYYACGFITLKLEWNRFSLLWEESLLLRADGFRATSLEAISPF